MFEGLNNAINEVADNVKDFPLFNYIGDLKDFIVNSFTGEENLDDYSNEYTDKAAELMGNIFTPEVIDRWGGMDLQQRADFINKYAQELGKAENINIIGVKVEDLVGKTGNPDIVGLNCGDGYLSLDVRQLQSPENLQNVLNTVTHESRHQFQNDVVQNPEKYDVDSGTIAEWKENLSNGNYIDPSEDREGYRNQPVEEDAYNAGDNSVAKWINGLHV